MPEIPIRAASALTSTFWGMSRMLEYATSPKINTYWTCEFENHQDGTATIHRHYRDGRETGHRIDGERVNRYSFEEADGRIVQKLRLYSPGEMTWQRGDLVCVLTVRNPQYVFSYGGEPIVKTDPGTYR